MSEDYLITLLPPERLLFVFQCRAPAFYYFPGQRYQPQAGHRRQRRPGWELCSSASLVHRPVDSRPHPHDSTPAASRRSPPASLDPNSSSPLHSMCWETVRVTRPACCAENWTRYPNPRKTSGAPGNPAQAGSGKETMATEVEGIVDIA